MSCVLNRNYHISHGNTFRFKRKFKFFKYNVKQRLGEYLKLVDHTLSTHGQYLCDWNNTEIRKPKEAACMMRMGKEI